MNQQNRKCVHADTDVLYITELEHLVAKCDERKKKLIKKHKFWGEDFSLNVGCREQMCGAGCVCVTMRVKASCKD